jgi:hypothetical protein
MRGAYPMSDKTKIKKMKLGLVLTPELRAELQHLLSGQCDVVYLEHIHFEDLCIEELKNDGLCIDDLKLKRGKIKCLKLKAVEAEDC